MQVITREDAEIATAPPPVRLRERVAAWAMAIAARRYDDAFGERKHELLGGLRGKVLELGPGTGTSLRYFDPSVQWIGLEPSAAMRMRLHEEAERLGRPVDVRDARAERIPLADGSVDAVVSSLVLCSVDDLDAALAETFRVLRPGGSIVVIEHVAAAPGTRLRRIQRLVARLWRALFAGCHPDRDTEDALVRAGFVDLDLEHARGPVPVPIVRPHILGTARRPFRTGLQPRSLQP